MIAKETHDSQKFSLPSPFVLAIGLSLLAWLAALGLTRPADSAWLGYGIELLGFWEKGFWELLDFSMQMMLILILGHALALSKPAKRIINHISTIPQNGTQAVVLLCFISLLTGLLNWGLGLVFSAILARHMAEAAAQRNMPINYPLLGAAAYSCMLLWHAGFSGSAPLKVAEPEHFLVAEIGIIPVTHTIFSQLNLTVVALSLLLLPLLLGRLAALKPGKVHKFSGQEQPATESLADAGAADRNRWLGTSFGLLMVLFALAKPFRENLGMLQTLNLNYINFLLFGSCLMAHGSISKFVSAVNQAITDGTGIMLQFPLYAGIMGMVKYSGLMGLLTQQMLLIASPDSFPIITLFSAGLVNIFVPSGGGQWIVQGPLIVACAQELQISIPKAIMALAYGDQLTNMMQPFWALPLLAITGLSARKILPYTLILMAAGFTIFALCLWLI
jgi:short-chain fatty acids transporter